MFENICSLPLTSDLFTQALHPSVPVLSVGLSAGHVQTYKLPDPTDVSSPSSPDLSPNLDSNGLRQNGIPRRSSLRRSSTTSAASESGFGVVDTAWRTKRHRGSCRSVAYSPDGDILFSAGSDGLVKTARSEDGQVVSKIAVPLDENGDTDPPALLHVLTPQHLILATDSSAVHFYDLRLPNTGTASISQRPTTNHHPHTSFVSSLTPLPASDTSTSGFPKQFVSTGGTTLAVTDLRRGVLVRSSDQDEELTSSVFVSGLHSGGTSTGSKVVVGDSSGVLTLWERGVWDDQDERIILDKLCDGVESLSAVPEHAQSQNQGENKLLACGLGDGRVRFVRLGINKTLVEWDCLHDDIEGVVALNFDVAGRMVSGGGQTVKLWRESMSTVAPFADWPARHPLTEDNDANVPGKLFYDSYGFGDEDEDDDESAAEEERAIAEIQRREAEEKQAQEEEEEEEAERATKRRKRKRKGGGGGQGKDRSGADNIMAFKGLV